MSHSEPEKPSNCNYEINCQDFYHLTAYHILVASSQVKQYITGESGGWHKTIKKQV